MKRRFAAQLGKVGLPGAGCRMANKADYDAPSSAAGPQGLTPRLLAKAGRGGGGGKFVPFFFFGLEAATRPASAAVQSSSSPFEDKGYVISQCGTWYGHDRPALDRTSRPLKRGFECFVADPNCGSRSRTDRVRPGLEDSKTAANPRIARRIQEGQDGYWAYEHSSTEIASACARGRGDSWVDETPTRGPEIQKSMLTRRAWSESTSSSKPSIADVRLDDT